MCDEKKEFMQKLRRGLGSAIVELQKDENKSKYRDIVLRSVYVISHTIGKVKEQKASIYVLLYVR